MPRRASAEDVAAISACVARAYAIYDGRLPVPPKPVLADYASVVRDKLTWLLEEDEQCVGVLVLVQHPDHLYIENVAVDPDYQGRGLGRLLLDFAESEAANFELRELRLITNALMEENRALYARRGYTETALRHLDGRDVVCMSKSLDA